MNKRIASALTLTVVLAGCASSAPSAQPKATVAQPSTTQPVTTTTSQPATTTSAPASGASSTAVQQAPSSTVVAPITTAPPSTTAPKPVIDLVNFSATNPLGGTVNVASYSGQPLAFWFWAPH